ncbi:MAG: sulfatase-like hydrolase/transferase [Anaerolineales bacterium]
MPSQRDVSRRDFLKLISLAALAYLPKPLQRISPIIQNGNAKNVIVLVFDAWSAEHIQFYGYPRQTMPNLERFLDHATVYHSHYAAGTFTTAGTSSLLTGLYPWSHRALSLGTGGIAKDRVQQNIFSVFAPTHSTLAYTQNKFADVMLCQMDESINTHLRTGAFNAEHRFLYNLPIFKNDAQIAFASLENNIFQHDLENDSSLFINPIYRILKMYKQQANDRKLEKEYPLGLPDDTEQFRLDDTVTGAINALKSLTEPSFVYFHFYPPHENYCPLGQFRDIFDGGWQAEEKPIHRLSWGHKSYKELTRLNRDYDEYIASWDFEVSRLFQYLQDSGLMDRSYIVVTADHGELNERGERGHFTSMLYEPLVHVPLMILDPNATARKDIHTPTSAVDMLPTLANLAGLPIPDWTEGKLLPGYGGEEAISRSLYAMDAKTNAAYAPITKATISLMKYPWRLTYYKYPNDEQFEFYDLEQDPEELKDLYPSQLKEARMLRDELLGELEYVNEPFG